jgi:hypothetical protein
MNLAALYRIRDDIYGSVLTCKRHDHHWLEYDRVHHDVYVDDMYRLADTV